MTSKENGNSPRSTEHKCMGIVEEARERREARKNKAQPWLVRKLAVFITIAMLGYGWYVYIGRLCVPMIRRDAGALGSRGLGIGFLIVFCILGLMTFWSYEKIVLTSPGLAKHHTQKSSPPLPRNTYQTWWDTESEADLAAARLQPPPNPPRSPPSQHHDSRHKRHGSRSERTTEAGQGHANSRRKPSENGHAPAPSLDENTGITDALPPVAAARAKATAGDIEPPPPSHQPEDWAQSQPSAGTESSHKPSMYTRKPSQTPILLPEYRYCHRDGFQKPMRAHHCRACGTCVLKYDHHCPWVGQCVGARNHKFFLIFVFWGLLFAYWMFATLVGLVARGSETHPNFEVDGQMIAIIVLSGFFMVFNTALLVTHFLLVTSNMSTVEDLGVRRMRERENRVLSRLHKPWHFRARRETKSQWDAEWGRIGKEGHIWWLGSARKNWEATMGEKWWMWFLPVGQSPDTGLDYVVNPRFDAEGRWMPRKDWPAELR